MLIEHLAVIHGAYQNQHWIELADFLATNSQALSGTPMPMDIK